jgi:hypothetical protein
MERFNWRCFFMALLIALAGLGMIGGCDSGEKALDEVTGKRAVKQYHKSKKDIEKIADQQAERHESIPDDDDKEEDER